MATNRNSRAMFWGCASGAALTIGVGVALLRFPFGDGLGRLSFDLPFLLRNHVPTEIVLVYLDTQTQANLKEPLDRPLSRRYHARLLDRLTGDGARLILYDFIFEGETEADGEFADAIRRNGKVILVAELSKQIQLNAVTDTLVLPSPILHQAAAGWGLANLGVPDPDLAIRRLYTGNEDYPSASWVGAVFLGARADQHPSRHVLGTNHWLNYYGPPSRLPAVNFDHALQEDGLPPGFFRDKIVVVGARPSVGQPGELRDEWPNPYSRFGDRLSSGAQIHALSLLNLTQANWLKRLGTRQELCLAVVWGLILGTGLVLCRPWHASWMAVTSSILIAGSAIYFQLHQNIWWSWMVPAVAQTPVAVAWAVACQYGVEARKRSKLRKAFSAYLSPYLADRISESHFDLSLGGQEVEATVMFTDLEGFTTMSETLPPHEVSKILTAYFNQTTRHLLEQEGTIIKYIGDAVMAVWGAPLPDQDHAERAVVAAWTMIQAGKQEIAGRLMRTRIGINTGPALAGNLGSDFRFDYTVIGATTNLASRLEDLNKLLGTDILISESTRQRLSKKIQVRYLGPFLVKGKMIPVKVYQVIGYEENLPGGSQGLDLFDQALELFGRRQFDSADKLLETVIQLRGGKDGPAQFYREQIHKFRGTLRSEDPWEGVIAVVSK